MSKKLDDLLALERGLKVALVILLAGLVLQTVALILRAVLR